MSITRILVGLVTLALLFPLANAACPEPELGVYPGWTARFSGEVLLDGTARAGDFEVKLTKVFLGDAVQVEISRLGSFYDRGAVTKGSDGILKKPDIWIELINSDSSANKANLTLYTPQRANMTINVTDIFAVRTVSSRRTFFPNEEFQVEFIINNSGELPAQELSIHPQFGDFQVIYTDAKNISLCQGSTYNFKYILRTPNVRKTFNYTLYLGIEYSDENIQIPKVSKYSELRSFDVEITPAQLEIVRKIGNWSIASINRDLTIEVLLNNSGESDVQKLSWSDSPPLDFFVISGITSFNGSLNGGSVRFFNYRVISDDPIICRSISTATYEDRFGNEYIAYSNDAIARFAPYLTIEKKLDELSYFLSPERSSVQGNKTLRLGDIVNVSVTIKNRGNAIARNAVIEDDSGSVVNGTNKFLGDLNPGQEASFKYTARVDKGDLNATVSMFYSDLNPDAFNASSVLEQGTPNYCSRTLKTVNYSVGSGLYILYPNISISSPSEIKALSEFEVEYNISIKNNGTDGAHDVFIYIDPADLSKAELRYGGAILKGQPLYFSKEFKAGAELNLTLILRAPSVENTTSFTITTRVNYTEFSGAAHALNATTVLIVEKPRPGFVIVKAIEKGLNYSISAANESEIGEYVIGAITLRSTGFSPLEKVNITLPLPRGVEFFTNDSRWEGRYEAQLKRENQTWYGFTDGIVWRSNLSRSEETKIEFLLRGSKAGLYKMPYNITFDGNSINGTLPLKVRGARLSINKTLDKRSITVGNEIEVVVEVVNVGEAAAKNVKLVDKPPANLQVTGTTSRTLADLDAGEATGVVYTVKPNQAGSYSSGVATVEWTDDLGNEYLLESEDFGIEVLTPIEFPELTRPPTAPPETPVATPAGPTLTRREVIITSVLTVMIMMILIRLLTLSRPPSGGEK